jgi:hypothetical protein
VANNNTLNQQWLAQTQANMDAAAACSAQKWVASGGTLTPQNLTQGAAQDLQTNSVNMPVPGATMATPGQLTALQTYVPPANTAQYMSPQYIANVCAGIASGAFIFPGWDMTKCSAPSAPVPPVPVPAPPPPPTPVLPKLTPSVPTAPTVMQSIYRSRPVQIQPVIRAGTTIAAKTPAASAPARCAAGSIQATYDVFNWYLLKANPSISAPPNAPDHTTQITLTQYWQWAAPLLKAQIAGLSGLGRHGLGAVWGAM